MNAKETIALMKDGHLPPLGISQSTYDDPCDVSAIITKVRGRPKKDDNKIHRFELRLTDDELGKLYDVSVMTGMPMAQVMVRALEHYCKIINRTY